MDDLRIDEFNDFILTCFANSQKMTNTSKFPLRDFIKLFSPQFRIADFCYLIANKSPKVLLKLKQIKSLIKHFSENLEKINAFKRLIEDNHYEFYRVSKNQNFNIYQQIMFSYFSHIILMNKLDDFILLLETNNRPIYHFEDCKKELNVLHEVIVSISRYETINRRLIGLYFFFNFSDQFAFACEAFLMTLTNNFIIDILKNQPQILISKTIQRIAEVSELEDQNIVTKIMMDQLRLKGNIENIFSIGYVLNISIEIILPRLLDTKSPKCPIVLDATSPFFPIKNQSKNLTFHSHYLTFAVIKETFVFFFPSDYQKLLIEERNNDYLFRIIKYIGDSNLEDVFKKPELSQVQVQIQSPKSAEIPRHTDNSLIKVICTSRRLKYIEFYDEVIEFNVENPQIFQNSEYMSLACPFCTKHEIDYLDRILPISEKNEIFDKILNLLFERGIINEITLGQYLSINRGREIFLKCIDKSIPIFEFKYKIIIYNSENYQIFSNTNCASFICPYCNISHQFEALKNVLDFSEISTIKDKIKLNLQRYNSYSNLQGPAEHDNNLTFIDHKSRIINNEPSINRTYYNSPSSFLHNSVTNLRSNILSSGNQECSGSHLKVHTQKQINNSSDFYEKLYRINLFYPELAYECSFAFFKCPDCSINFTKTELLQLFSQSDLRKLQNDIENEYKRKNPNFSRNSFSFQNRNLLSKSLELKSFQSPSRYLNSPLISSVYLNRSINQNDKSIWHCNTGGDSKIEIMKNLIQANLERFINHKIEYIDYLECSYCHAIMFGSQLLKYLTASEIRTVKEEIYKMNIQKGNYSSIYLKQSNRMNQNSRFSHSPGNAFSNSNFETNILFNNKMVKISCFPNEISKSNLAKLIISSNLSTPHVFQEAGGEKCICPGCYKSIQFEGLRKIFSDNELDYIKNEIKSRQKNLRLTATQSLYNFKKNMDEGKEILLGQSHPKRLIQSNYFHCTFLKEDISSLKEKIIHFNFNKEKSFNYNTDSTNQDSIFCPFCFKKIENYELKSYFDNEELYHLKKEINLGRTVQSSYNNANAFQSPIKVNPHDLQSYHRANTSPRIIDEKVFLHCSSQIKSFMEISQEIIALNQKFPKYWLTQNLVLCPNCRNFVNLGDLLIGAKASQILLIESQLNLEVGKNNEFGKPENNNITNKFLLHCGHYIDLKTLADSSISPGDGKYICKICSWKASI